MSGNSKSDSENKISCERSFTTLLSPSLLFSTTVCVDEVEPPEATESKEEVEEERTNLPDSCDETSDISSSISDNLAIFANDRIDGKGKRNK